MKKERSFESAPSFLPNRADGQITTDTSANIYQSMLLSPAWHNLTGKQKELYYVCKAQYYGEKKTAEEHRTAKEKIDGVFPSVEARFTMNQSKWRDFYGLYTTATQRYFYKDMQALIDNGFIKELESGKTSGTKSIYEYSEEWAHVARQKRESKLPPDKREYQMYLISPKWKAIRQQVAERDNYTCQLCGEPVKDFEIHHKTYEYLYHEEDDLSCLVCLCKTCHHKKTNNKEQRYEN